MKIHLQEHMIILNRDLELKMNIYIKNEINLYKKLLQELYEKIEKKTKKEMNRKILPNISSKSSDMKICNDSQNY